MSTIIWILLIALASLTFTAWILANTAEAVLWILNQRWAVLERYGHTHPHLVSTHWTYRGAMRAMRKEVSKTAARNRSGKHPVLDVTYRVSRWSRV